MGGPTTVCGGSFFLLPPLGMAVGANRQSKRRWWYTFENLCLQYLFLQSDDQT
jgi:hypothetical protein